ncbi:MAG: hypothetical protein CML29_10570 [Rhizobiales bacterium]|nr:hypothetical protein [Hyphomicrobiales bacterium]MBA67894.1 hypothetical protein [Hyphomicrobiales bacterium]|tara:strand:+ start:1519 stop:1746 length:228 start_codon:yes stop_codon:yes gene_type:complete
MDFDGFLKFVFGSSRIEDLALPMVIGLFALTALFFFVVMTLGKRRRQRQIDAYNATLADHSLQLRRGGRTPRLRR